MKIKIRGPETLGTGPCRQSLQNHQTAQSSRSVFQRRPKIESRQKSEGPPQWFDSSLFAGELSVVGPCLGVPGRRAQDSFPLPVKLFRSWDIHLQPLPASRVDVSQSKPGSAPATLWVCFCMHCALIRAVASEKGQLGGPIL